MKKFIMGLLLGVFLGYIGSCSYKVYGAVPTKIQLNLN